MKDIRINNQGQREVIDPMQDLIGDNLPEGVEKTPGGHLYPRGGQHNCRFPDCPANTETVAPKIILVEADEEPRIPLNEIKCLQTCGTAHRGCDPLCPREAAERGLEEGAKKQKARDVRVIQEFIDDLGQDHPLSMIVKSVLEDIENDD